MPAVKISARLKLDENISFLDGHQRNNEDNDDDGHYSGWNDCPESGAFS
jgi:hypothetical protein